ncbi:MAG: hypothetical protein K6357_07010 [Elusimicrobiota bacterium]
MRCLFIIDSYAFLFKNYYALPKFMTSKGEEVGAVYGFIRLVLKIRECGEYIVACYDSGKSFRREISDIYKANRKKTDEALLKQIKTSKEILKMLGIVTIEKEGYEADDLIATLAKKAAANNFEVVIVGADKDLFQIVDNNIKISDSKLKEYYGPEYVKSKFQVDPENLLSYFALVGDSSDNIKGVEGIGPKTAVKLINKYGNIESIIEKSLTSNEKELVKIRNSIENIKTAIQLIKLDSNVPIEFNIGDFKVGDFKKEALLELAMRFEFKDILKLAGGFKKDERAFEFIDNENFIAMKKDYVSISDYHASYKEFYTNLNSELLRKLFEEKSIKYFYNVKKFFHLALSDCVYNFHDIYIAYHLVFGGFRKPDIDRIIQEKFFVDAEIKSVYFKEIMDDLMLKIEENSMNSLYANELALSKVLYRMEKNGIKVSLDALNSLSVEFEEKINEISSKFIETTGIKINLNSPKQISEFLFKKMNLKLDDKYSRIYSTKSGEYSTSEDVLNILKPYAPEIIDLILMHREYSKLKSFVETIKENTKNGRVHTNFDQTTTHTGRLSSSSPNLQNIPSKTNNAQKIRNCFLPDDGYFFVSFDYSQIDLRVLAHLSEDESLIQSFKNDDDIHVKTAASIFNIPEDNVDYDLRRIAKTINFGIIYGQTPMGLSIESGISYEEATKYIESYFKRYSGVKKWISDTVEFARKNGYVINFMNRKRFLPDILSPNRAIRSQSERMAINMPVQSGSSDIIKKAMVEIYRDMKDCNDINLLIQIHDELLFEIKKDTIEKYIPRIKSIMENSFKLNVPIKVDVKVGENWASLVKWK